jgi:hypothetical protein
MLTCFPLDSSSVPISLSISILAIVKRFGKLTHGPACPLGNDRLCGEFSAFVNSILLGTVYVSVNYRLNLTPDKCSTHANVHSSWTYACHSSIYLSCQLSSSTTYLSQSSESSPHFLEYLLASLVFIQALNKDASFSIVSPGHCCPHWRRLWLCGRRRLDAGIIEETGAWHTGLCLSLCLWYVEVDVVDFSNTTNNTAC